jgi:hypothetical protein
MSRYKITDAEFKKAYEEYLLSEAWNAKRQAVYERCHGVCERCKQNTMSDAHHLTYERVFDELLIDLLGVCRPCHKFLHKRSYLDPVKEQLAFARVPDLWDDMGSWMNPYLASYLQAAQLEEITAQEILIVYPVKAIEDFERCRTCLPEITQAWRRELGWSIHVAIHKQGSPVIIAANGISMRSQLKLNL